MRIERRRYFRKFLFNISCCCWCWYLRDTNYPESWHQHNLHIHFLLNYLARQHREQHSYQISWWFFYPGKLFMIILNIEYILWRARSERFIWANWGNSTSTSRHSTLLEASSQHWNCHSPHSPHSPQQLFTPLILRCVGKNPQFEIACWDCFNYVNKMVYGVAAYILKSMNSFIKYPHSVTRFKYLLPISSKRGFEIWGSS